MTNFTTRETFLVPSFELDLQEREKLDRFLLLLEKSNVKEFFPKKSEIDLLRGGRPSYNPYDLLATILYGFAFRSATLRELETSCKYDLRYIYLMQQRNPNYVVFGNFINEVIKPNRKEIFKRIVNEIVKEIGITLDDCFVDGSKFEADANKYKFVWKPTIYHERLSDKIRTFLVEMNLQKNVPEKGIISSEVIARKLSDLSVMVSADASLKKKYDQLFEYLKKALEYEEKERICGPERNSYYKTDTDATAMTLKQDYYSGLGSNMHAAYNTQLAVSKGIICSYYVSQSRNDIDDFIPVLEAFYDIFGYYPVNVCADSGYGSLDNYRFLKEHHIGNYVKYYTFDGNVTGKNPDRYFLNDNETITCLNNLTGNRVEIEGRHPRKAGSTFYKIEGCRACPFTLYCNRFTAHKDENHKIFEVQEELTYFKQEAFDNLLAPKGIELRVNRSSQVEGAFGVLKEDLPYTRLRRTRLPQVETEFMLTFLGFNIRKLFRHFSGKASFTYWVMPEGLEPEVKRKPSAKRLSNKVSKKKNDSVNEKARDYKYKSLNHK